MVIQRKEEELTFEYIYVNCPKGKEKNGCINFTKWKRKLEITDTPEDWQIVEATKELIEYLQSVDSLGKHLADQKFKEQEVKKTN